MSRPKRAQIWDEHPILLRILEDVPDELKYPESRIRGSGAVPTASALAMIKRACEAVAKSEGDNWIHRDAFASSDVSNDPAARLEWNAVTPDAEHWCNIADRRSWNGKPSDRIAAGWYCQAQHAWNCAEQAYIDAEE